MRRPKLEGCGSPTVNMRLRSAASPKPPFPNSQTQRQIPAWMMDIHMMYAARDLQAEAFCRSIEIPSR